MPLLDPVAADLLADAQARRLVPPAQAAALADAVRTAPFSLNVELRTLLYLGVVALSGGLGALLYQHHERLGPGVILALMAALMTGAFWYAARYRPAFTWGVAPRVSVGADYALLLGCLLFLGIETYAQVEYRLFGERYGVAAALPALLFIGLAYRYDHRGVLAMGLTALAAWAGLAVAPASILNNIEFVQTALRGTTIGLGVALSGVAFYSEWMRRKAHFAPTFLSLGANLTGAGLASLLIDGWDSVTAILLGAVGLAGLCFGLYQFARRTHSHWFLVLAAGWGYFLVTYLWVRLMIATDAEEGAILLSILYFVFSTFAIIRFFLNLKKLLPPPPTA
jgi:Predicted membrane protein (DUF2157)